jgi:acetolactate synthase-1/2/3 large subunit
MLAKKTDRGADVLARTLREAGVARMFTLSGNHIMPVFDAAIDAGIELIHTRHEAAAVHMADAHARLTGEPTVALVTGGPGHSNAASALYTATLAESPVVLLSGHAPNAELGMGAFQEMAQADVAAPLAKASWTCKGADHVASDVRKALRLAVAGRAGRGALEPAHGLPRERRGPRAGR